MAEVERSCDVLVAGSGAAGFAAAITARLLGLDVVMVEKDAVYGGTSAQSGGIPWVPGTRYADGDPAEDTVRARTYLRHELGNRYDAAMIDAYLESGPEMVDFLEQAGAVAFKSLSPYPDYHSEIEGAALGGRGLRPVAYDGRRLGKHFATLRPPISELMLFGGMSLNGEHLHHYYAVTRSLKSFAFVTGRVARYAVDRLSGWSRGTELSSGNALIGRLAEKAFALDIPLLLSTPVVELIEEDGRIAGAVVIRDSVRQTIRARRGVIFATGGFSHDPTLRAAYFAPEASASLTSAGNEGDAARMAVARGGEIDDDMVQPATWLPMSAVLQPGGGTAFFPHLADRNKPGFITVNQRAERFVNESVSYQDFVPPMVATLAGEARREVYLICDHRALRRYGIGPVRPHPVSFGRWLRNGYLVGAPSVEGLAMKLGLDPERLAQTVARFNGYAVHGADPDFGRGSTAYQRAMGDMSHRPSPSVGPLDQAPFYAVRLVPGDIGTSVGLRTTPDAQVIGREGPIPGLYAVGNDMANPTMGVYPGPGVTLGPAMTFGYRAAKSLAQPS
ncbi:FAD-dependent oxidoreductase [Sphingomonas crocodyli]|uniref:FAD-dependent oxidoreductase n=1 Tax=Sphingomonas crocodyli TaxID=1979270 RepID=UPI0013E2BC2F|nr:FAD-dependent oxidoreductase [Sphingomonas crocodyli]